MWIIELRAPDKGQRYFTRRGRGVTLDIDKATRFASRAVAEDQLAKCTLWPERRVLPLEDAPASVSVTVNSVIQLDPTQSSWGPLLCIVDEVRSWGVRCYAFMVEDRHELPSRMYLRVEHGKYIVIGAAEWSVVTALDSPGPESA